MMRHPLMLAVAVGDALSVLLLLRAAASALQILSSWDPASCERRQLRLERRAETDTMAAGYGLGFFFIASVLAVSGISTVLPALVPGAMCGTGVVQGSAGLLNKALAFRALAVAAAYLWAVLSGLDRRQPDAPLALPRARLLLLAAALVTAAAVLTFKAFSALDLHQPVDCCAVVYSNIGPAANVLGPSAWGLTWAFGAGTCALAAGAFGVRAAAGPGRRLQAATILCVVLAAWIPLAALALAHCFVAYTYEVMQHRCLWCLFLPEHGRVGYALLAALTVAGLEGPVAWAAAKAETARPQLAGDARRRCRAAAARVLVAGSAFAALAVLPAVLWRVRFGVWMG